MAASIRTRSLIAAAALLAAVASPLPCDGHFMAAMDVPAARVIANIKARLAKSQDDAEAWYNLGRVHAYLVTHGGPNVPVQSPDEPTKLYDLTGPQPTAAAGFEKAAEHAAAAIDAFNRAIRLRPAQASYRYALACVAEAALPLTPSLRTAPMLDVDKVDASEAEQAARIVDSLQAPGPEADRTIAIATRIPATFGDRTDPASLRAFTWTVVRARKQATGPRCEALDLAFAAAWRAEIGEQYFAAYSLGFIADSRHTQQGLTGLSDFLSFQAANDYLRFVPAEHRPPVRTTVVEAAVAAFKTLPPCGAITPIIIPMTSPGDAGIESMLARDVHVTFDLDGTGRGLTWSWVKPTTGILVWDPSGKGRITSGRQLLGSATWWTFFEDGYRALDALDDDRDGRLKGRELDGLALWFDGDADGVCDRGEVVSLRSRGIIDLAVRATGSCPDGSLVSDRGVRFSDGRALPTYDWVTRPVAPSAAPVSLR
jgi:hypothetical protein